MKAKSTSRKMPKELNQFLSRTGITKRELSKDMHVVAQTITDWTKEDGTAKNLTAENAVRLNEVANNSSLAQVIGYYYLGLPPSMNGEYKLDLSYLDDLREIEEDERDEKLGNKEMKRILCKTKALDDASYDKVLDAAREQAEVCIVNNQFLFALCDVLGLSAMELIEMFMQQWISEGYFGGKST